MQPLGFQILTLHFEKHFGRPVGFAGAALFMALGNVMYAACRNVETYLVS